MAYTTINKSSLYMNNILYTGNSVNGRSITGIGFQPDLVWVKCRNAGGNNHVLSDSVRGTNKNLQSNSSSAEIANNSQGWISAFGSDGFTTYGANSSYNEINGNGNTYVAWNWKANGAGSANTAGSINSTVSASATSGFSIVKWTGSGANATIGHGLSVPPKMILFKNTSRAIHWVTYDSNGGAGKYLHLEDSFAYSTSTSMFNNTEPTSSVFSVGGNNQNNTSSENIIAYCFADVQGYSKVGGSYVGNGSTDGTFVYTGFKPAFVMMKNTSNATSSDWLILDNKRNTFNPESNRLNANTTSTDISATWVNTDFLSNGFKLKTSDETINESGNTFIYMAFAEAPLVGTNGVTAKAR